MIIYYYLASILFTLGLIGLLVKQDLISMLLSLEVLLASVSVFYGLFSKAVGSLDPQIQVLFIIIIAAAEAAIGLTLIIQLMKKNNSVYVCDILENSEP